MFASFRGFHLLRLSVVVLALALLVTRPASAAQDSSQRTSTAASSQPAEMFQNPIGVPLADPSVLVHEGTYYLYATSDPDRGFKAWTSQNLRDWEEQGMVLEKNEASWGQANYWAPDVIAHKGRFYLFYSAMGQATAGRHGLEHRICVATSDSPLGPFTDAKAPLFDFGYAAIDAFPFVDSDGFAWLYYARDISQNPTSDIYVVPLAEDLLSIAGDPIKCISPAGHQAQAWELGEWNEGPFVLEHRDSDGDRIYLLAYSAGGFFRPEYAVGYARAKSPLGPWIKAAENPILAKRETPAGFVSGPGHGGFFRSVDGKELFYAYHIHINPTGGHERELAIDRAYVEEDPGSGLTRLRIDGPTRGKPLPLPSGAESVVGQ